MQVSGGIFGELDFFLRHPRSFAAVSSTDDCTIQVLIPRGGRLIATDCDGLRLTVSVSIHPGADSGGAPKHAEPSLGPRGGSRACASQVPLLPGERQARTERRRQGRANVARVVRSAN